MARYMTRPVRFRINSDTRFARKFGLTLAGLNWLTKAAGSPDGHTGRQGNEIARLEAAGLAVDNGKVGTRTDGSTYKTSYPTVTDAGRDIVRRARALGW